MNFSEFVEKSKSLELKFQVTEDVYNTFQKMSHDMNPLHVNEEFAKRKGFPARVMYGNILNGFVSYFVGMALPIPDVMIQTQDIQYRKPVFLNDEIILKSEIEYISDAVKIVNYKLKFYKIGEPKNILVATGHVQVGVLTDKN